MGALRVTITLHFNDGSKLFIDVGFLAQVFVNNFVHRWHLICCLDVFDKLDISKIHAIELRPKQLEQPSSCGSGTLIAVYL